MKTRCVFHASEPRHHETPHSLTRFFRLRAGLVLLYGDGWPVADICLQAVRVSRAWTTASKQRDRPCGRISGSACPRGCG
jgi:hypothetical protein